MAGGGWLGAEKLAEAAGVTRRSATRILQRGHLNGVSIETRQAFGRGGRSGLSYQVSLASVEAALNGRQTGAEEPALEFRANAANQDQVIGARLAAIRPVLELPEKSSVRRQATADAADRMGVTVRTVERWLADYERSGIAALGRRKPSNAGKPRIHVSQAFDRLFREAGHSDDALAELGRVMEANLKGLWASRAEAAGWGEVRRLAEFLLLEACEAQGVALPPAAFTLSRRQVERFAQFRIVNVMRNDRKRFDDNKPRIRRDWTGLAPMERVVADVHPIDVVVTRADGSPAWPKLIGFMDAGTGRLFHHLVLLPPGEGIRQEHVTEAFLAMVAHPEWGFPRGLYLDNGSEFAHLTKLKAALELINEPDARTVIFARPYNASAKPIESLFGRLERYVFSQLPGYAGGNRMAKKTQNVGKATQPYPGSWDGFCRQVDALILGFNARPVGGQWKGKAPLDWLADKAAEGWRPAVIDPLAIDSLFSDRETRRVEKGGVVNFRGQRWTHPAMAALPARTVVEIAVPWRRGEAPLFMTPGLGWAYLSPELVLPAEWTQGAEESGRRQRAHGRHVRGLAKAAPGLDPAAVAGRLAERARTVALPPPDLAIDPGAQLADLAAAKAALPAPPDPMTAQEADRARRDRETARLLRLQEKLSA